MATSYKLQFEKGEELKIITEKGNVSLQSCKIPDRDIFMQQLEFFHKVINGINTGSQTQSEIIGKQLWKFIATTNLGDDQKGNFFKELPAEALQKCTLIITYDDENMEFECSIPWELFCFRMPDNDFFYPYKNENISVIRKYVHKRQNEDYDKLFYGTCKILIYVAGPVTEEYAKKIDRGKGKLGTDCVKYIPLQQKLEAITAEINQSDKKNIDGKKIALEFEILIETDFEEFCKKLTAYQPAIVHIITHGRFEEKEAQILVNESIIPAQPRFVFQDIKTFCTNLENGSAFKPDCYILEICQLGRSTLPLKLSRLGAKIVIANMFDINQDISQSFYCDFYSNLFNPQNSQTIIDAFHNSRREIFKLKEEYGLKYIGLPVLYYNLNINKEKLFLSAEAAQKTGGNILVTDNEEIFAPLNTKLSKLKAQGDDELAKSAVNQFFLYFPFKKDTKDEHYDLYLSWVRSLSEDFAAYNNINENYDDLYKKRFSESSKKITVDKPVTDKQELVRSSNVISATDAAADTGKSKESENTLVIRLHKS
ncbi:MAG: CHAT domain-containing protein [Parafilimonas sp.]